MCMRTEKVRNKIKSRAGETITETLVALLISALALVMLAGVITTSTRIVNKSRDSLASYYDACNDMVEVSESAESGTGVVTIKGSAITDASGLASDIKESVSYVEGAAGEKTVISYRKSN